MKLKTISRTVEIVAVCLMVTIVLLVTAKNPWDGDEFIRGPIAGIVGCIIGWVFRGIIGTVLGETDIGDQVDVKDVS